MADKNHLYLVWTNADPVSSEFMVLGYAINSMKNGWWEKVTVVIWGGSQKLVMDSEAIRDKIKMAQHYGVEFSACVGCALQIGAVETLESLGIEVVRWGQRLTELKKDGAEILSI